ncbi:Uncharacterized protein FWK35_00001211, partial [Aphis craccivora]
PPPRWTSVAVPELSRAAAVWVSVSIAKTRGAQPESVCWPSRSSTVTAATTITHRTVTPTAARSTCSCNTTASATRTTETTANIRTAD